MPAATLSAAHFTWAVIVMLWCFPLGAAAMPEIRELVASYLHLVYLLRNLMFFTVYDPTNLFSQESSTKGWPLEAIWADPVIKESNKANASAREKARLPITIDANDKRERGGSKKRKSKSKTSRSKRSKDVKAPVRGPLWPPGFANLDTLRLVNVYYTARSLILDFGVCFLDMHYLTHTSLQLFSIEEWRKSVQDVKAEVTHRSYKIVIALQFPQYVLAFLTKDLVAFPRWVLERPTPPPEVCPGHDPSAPESNLDFLLFFANWLDGTWEKLSGDGRFAIALVRELVETFHGVGLYSASEIFIMAGLWPGLRVYELFMCPSRVGRLLEAIFAFVHIAKKEFLRQVIIPALHAGTVIAPTREQRKNFASHYLLAWAKECMTTHSRFGDRVREFETALRDSNISRYDPFEPTYIAVAFLKPVHLAHLIFGLDDEQLCAAGIKPSSTRDDPVTALFRRRGLANAPTNLPSYQPLIIPHSEFHARQNRAFLKTHLYRCGNGPVWSINSPPSDLSEEDERTRSSSLFKHIVDKTNDVAIGPLEYKGMAQVFSNGRQTYVAVSNADIKALRGKGRPHFITKLRSQIRHSMRLPCDQPGQRKRAPTEAERSRIESALTERLAELDALAAAASSGSEDDSDSDTDPEPRPIKRRRCADAQIVEQTNLHTRVLRDTANTL